MESARSYDIIIIGAGISGINAAYRVQTGLPSLSYTILEARDALGGTWDFWRYPGLRSDSDMSTFAFPWAPWTSSTVIGDGASIIQYLRDTAAAHGIDRNIEYRRKVSAAAWSSHEKAWTLSVGVGDEKDVRYKARFIVLCTGYYDYAAALPAVIPGLENFKGTVVHPQWWPEDLKYADKRVAIIGSGATAVTLLPSLALEAAHVTMVQRSPTYIVPVLRVAQPTFLDNLLLLLLPLWLVREITRLRAIVLSWFFFNFCRAFPDRARKLLRAGTEKLLPAGVPYDPHFTPAYDPWEQRMCATPDGEFYAALRAGRASVATGHIASMAADEVVLASGERVRADIVVTATGLRVQMAGGMRLAVDGAPLVVGDKFAWREVMLQDVPNLAFAFGYTNASWTLGADTAAQHFVRIVRHMQDREKTVVVPRVEDPAKLRQVPAANLNSTYLRVAKDLFPKQADRAPWRGRRGYLRDILEVRVGDISSGLEYRS
jgi:cation diffusion facilitator CzcD-associated flavoprotein CzcO